MNVTLVKTRNYNNEQRTMSYELLLKTNPIQTQNKPKQSQSNPISPPPATKQTQNKPKQSQFHLRPTGRTSLPVRLWLCATKWLLHYNDLAAASPCNPQNSPVKKLKNREFFAILMHFGYNSFVSVLYLRLSGCSSVWPERLLWEQEAVGSNPITPIRKSSLLVQ